MNRNMTQALLQRFLDRRDLSSSARLLLLLLLAASTAVLSACASGAGSQAVSGGPVPADTEDVALADAAMADDEDDDFVEWDDDASTLDGVYTEGQAARGRQVFENVCSNCHETPEWQEDRFLQRWQGESVFRFFFYVWERMPNGEPPYSLPRQDVTDVVTYILQLNGLPSGDAELASDDDGLSAFWLYWSEADAASHP
jgi:cytochrome c5